MAYLSLPSNAADLLVFVLLFVTGLAVLAAAIYFIDHVVATIEAEFDASLPDPKDRP